MGAESEDVRYGRARLTVARSGSLLAEAQSRKVERLGDRLEGDIAALGTGDGELVRPDRYRGAAPKAPPKPSDRAQNQDDGQSQS